MDFDVESGISWTPTWMKTTDNDDKLMTDGTSIVSRCAHSTTHSKEQNVINYNPFTSKFKKYILPTFWREMYKWGSENG